VVEAHRLAVLGRAERRVWAHAKKTKNIDEAGPSHTLTDIE
jgi:hypothetical protein